MNESLFYTLVNAMFIIVPILLVCGFIFIIALAFSPRLSAKMMKNQMKTVKYLFEDNKNDMTNSFNTLLKVQKDMLNQNEEILKDIATKKANIEKEGIEIKSRAVKKGFEDE